jgi:hypothetical protein
MPKRHFTDGRGTKWEDWDVRFTPIPPAWHELPDGVLRVMLDVSDPVRTEPISGERPVSS